MFDIASVDMSTAPVGYGYDADDIYTAPEPFSIDPLESEMAGEPVWLQPGNTLTVPPGELREGYAQQRVGDTWKEVEDHRGKSGYVNGQPHEIKEYGPLPDGWSYTLPPPTEEELFVQLRDARATRLDATDKYLMPDYPISTEGLAEVKAYRQALRDLPAQPGAPWDGGGELTPWPELPTV